jgi:non-ribosomal peptide synthetase component F
MDVAGLLAEVDRNVSEALEHRDYPLDVLVREINPARRANRQALFNVVYTFQNFTDVRIGTDIEDGLQVSDPVGQQQGFELAFETSKFDLCLFAAERAGGLRLSLEYDTQLFLPPTARRFLDTLAYFARQVAGGYREATDAAVEASNG